MSIHAAIVVMGPAGCGKSTIGRLLAQGLDCDFVEGDELHSPASIDKMSQGVALTDEDRWPWLERIADAVSSRMARHACVASCSALKRIYRDRIRERCVVPVLFVLPDVSRDLLLARLLQRTSHYMPATLLDSQLAILERPTADEWTLRLDGSLPPAVLTALVMQQLA